METATGSSTVLQGPLEHNIALHSDTVQITPAVQNTSTANERQAPEELFKANLDKPQVQQLQTWWENLQHKFENGPKWFQTFRDKFSIYLNSFGIAFNALGVVGLTNKVFPEKVGKFLDKKSEWYSRYVVPLSFLWSGVEALMGNRPFETGLRFIPAISFWALPFYNFSIATGISSGFNTLLGLVNQRHGGKQPNKTMAENTQVVFKTFADLFYDAMTGKGSREELKNVIASSFMLGGSLGGLLFATQDRNTIAAKFWGNLRNLGGLITDVSLAFSSYKPDRVVGATCGTASLLNIFMRWVPEDIARMINHVAIALDDFGLTYWAHESKRQNDKTAKQKPEVIAA